MNQQVNSPIVVMSGMTAEALRRRGGNLYVWLAGAGLPTAGTTPPNEAITYTTVPYGDGLSVHIDSGITPSDEWTIKWTRLPWPHFKAICGPHATGWSGPTFADVLDALLRR